jgi:hypothetical protein
MKINTDDYLTAQQAADAMKTNKRAVWRARARAEKDGKETFVLIFGRTLLPRNRLPVLRSYYFPGKGAYQKANKAKVKAWAASGGRAKAAKTEPKAPKVLAPPLAEGVKRGRGRPRKYLRPDGT